MKKCPFCSADIEENAKFCLYCMKSLEAKTVIHKKKRPLWVFYIVGVCLLCLALWLIPKATAGDRTSPMDSVQVSAQVSATTPVSTAPKSITTLPEDSIQPPLEQEESSPETTTTPGNTATTPDSSAFPTVIVPPVTEPIISVPDEPQPQVTEPSVTEPTSTDPVSTESETTTPPSWQTAPVYIYRLAEKRDDFYSNYTNPGNEIVITGVSVPASDGIYSIPAYIDNYRVMGITANAFSWSEAKIVYIPSTVITISDFAFAGCNITDIYLQGESIYISPLAFTAIQTIHCSATCNNRNFRLYKNYAPEFGARWEEWNG